MSNRIALDSLGRLGTLVWLLGFIPWHVPRLCVPFAVSLLRVLRVLALGLFNASPFEAVSFSVALGNYFVPLCGIGVVLHPAAGNCITHRIRTSRFLVVASSGGDSQAAKLALAQHRQRLRQHGDRLAIACYVVSFAYMLVLTQPRVAVLLDGSVEDNHDVFSSRVDVPLAEAMGDWGYVLLLAVTDVVVIVAVVMALCVVLWLFSTATHDLVHLTTAHDSTASDVDDILEGREVHPRARFMLDDSALADPVSFDLLDDVHDERDVQLQVSSSLLQEKPTAMLLLEEIEFQSQLLARLQSHNAFVAKVVLVAAVTGLGLTGQFVAVDAISSIVSRKPRNTMIMSLFALAVTFCMIAFCVGFGARFMRRSRALQTALKRAKADLLDPEQHSVANDLLHSGRSDTMSMVSLLDLYKLTDTSGSFWKLLRSVYGRVLFHTAYITAIAIGFVALLDAVRMPSCSHVEVRRSLPMAVFLTTDCSDAENAQALAGAGFINAFVSVVSPAFMLMIINNASVREYGDIVPVSLVLAAAAATSTFVLGLERHERFARTPPLVFGLLNIVFVCYHAAFPGQSVSRAAVPVRAAVALGGIILWLLFQIILIGGVLVTRFVLVSESGKLFIAVILFPIISFCFRHILGLLCSQYDQRVDRNARKAVALHSCGHMYLSLISRMLVAALASLRDQVLTVAVWMLFEIGTRTVGPLLHGCVWFLVLPDGPARQAKLEHAEQERTDTAALRRIYAHMLSELVSIPTAVITVLLMRQLLSSGIDPAFKSEWASSQSLLGSLAVQLLFEVVTDVLSILSEELVLECDCLALWRRHDVRHALASLLAVIVCVAASLEEFSVLMGNFVRK